MVMVKSITHDIINNSMSLITESGHPCEKLMSARMSLTSETSN